MGIRFQESILGSVLGPSYASAAGIQIQIHNRMTAAHTPAARKKAGSDAGKKKEVSKERLESQKAVDAAILKNIKDAKEPLLAKYLGARFTLSNNDKPHELKF